MGWIIKHHHETPCKSKIFEVLILLISQMIKREKTHLNMQLNEKNNDKLSLFQLANKKHTCTHNTSTYSAQSVA